MGIQFEPKRLRHIFRKAQGHVDDTSENRKLLIDAASKTANHRGDDQFGNSWFAAVQDDGSQVWVVVRNGRIINGGINEVPRPI